MELQLRPVKQLLVKSCTIDASNFTTAECFFVQAPFFAPMKKSYFGWCSSCFVGAAKVLGKNFFEGSTVGSCISMEALRYSGPVKVCKEAV